jgi:serine/threonine protein kinase
VEQAEVERLLMKPTARRRLGKYVLLGRLGHGGMGKIYLAYHPGPAGIEKLLVIKRLHSHLTNDELLVSSFLDEARLSMALTHPNIVHTFDVGEVEGRYFMVMEHIDGQNLGVLLRTAKRSGNYPPSDTWAGLFLSVLEGLHAAHTAHDARGRPLNIIHRDISPQNVLITYDGTPKLVDFGIAKAAMRINETDAGVLKGKYAYMSPEQCEGHELDPRSDVFSAGIVLWEMLAGRRLYKSDSVLRSVERILHEPPISPVKVNAECDPALARVVLKALQKKPTQRFSSAEDFRDALEDVQRRQGSAFKKSMLRELMHTCFGDVMARQREVLDRCLAGDIPTEDSGDSEAGQPRGRFESDSQSDLKVPEIGISVDMEPTTPSKVRVSPLVTEEGDSELAGLPQKTGMATRQERKTPGVPEVAPSAATAAYEAQDVVSEPRRKRRGLLAAALLLFFVIVAVGAVFVSGAADPLIADLTGAPPTDGDTTREPDRSSAATGGDGDTAADAEAPANGRGREVASSDSEPGAAGPGGDDQASSSPQDSREAEAGDDRPKAQASDRPPDERAEPDRKRRNRRERRRVRKPRRDRDGATTSASAASSGDTDDGDAEREAAAERERQATAEREVKEAQAAKEREAREARERARAQAATGKLTLATSPWVEVFLGGKKLGNTPLVNVPVPSGELTLRLKNAEEGIDQAYFLVVKPGKTTKKRLGLK